MNRRTTLRRAFALTLSLAALARATAQDASEEQQRLQSALIPKREIGQTEFLAAHPDWDGRGIVIAIFDTGVDPAAAGLAVTSTGERKILDLLDASGSGDVDTTRKVSPGPDGTLPGLSGRSLHLPPGLSNPAGEFRLGLKRAEDIFPRRAYARLVEYEEEQWKAERSRRRAERERAQRTAARSFEDKAPEDRTRAELDQAAREAQLEALEEGFLSDRAPIHYDCVVWNDGSDWRVLVDTDRDGDLADETMLRPFGVAGEYAVFDEVSNLSFGVQVYEEGDLLSLVTVSGTHGSHVASIAAAHFPDAPQRDGIAPGARIVSIRIGDPRTGGSSYGTSERRAVALAAQLGVDVVNASWGGLSVYQDGHDSNSKAYDMLVERYGIFAVMSAGNEGPALSTAGSAGGEARRVLGVGAYVSPEMGEVLYSALGETGEAPLQFTSRGPTKDGDWGVDVMAPGAAVASYSRDSLQRVDLANGTSMASPSAAGAAAVLLSAARQEGLQADPARLRAAFMHGARAVPGETSATQGAGLVNLEGAWDSLRAMQEEPAFGAFYDLEVSNGTFAAEGRGFYLREPQPEERLRVVVNVQPQWIEAVSAAAEADFEVALRLRSTADWITAPEYFHLANGENYFIAHVTTPSAPADRMGAYFFGEVEALIVGHEELGPVFTVPFTVARGYEGADLVEQPLERTVHLSPAQTERWLLDVPAGADHLKVKVRHEAADPIARRFVLHPVTLAEEVPMSESGDPEYMRLEEGEERTFLFPTIGNQVMELALYQFWSSVGPADLAVSLQWTGLGLPPQPIDFLPNQGWGVLPLQALTDQKVAVEGTIDQAHYVYLPVESKTIAFDERAELPGSPDHPASIRQRRQRQVFKVSFDEPLKVNLWYSQSYDESDYFGGGLTEVFHESGERLFAGGSGDWARFEFPAGESTIIRTFDQVTGDGLEETGSWPLVLRHELKKEGGLAVYANLRARFEGKPSEELELPGGAPSYLFLKDKSGDDLADFEPSPNYFTGTVTFADEQDVELGTAGVLYLAGQSFAGTVNQEPEPASAKDPRTEAKKLADALFERRLAFVRDQRGAETPDAQAERDRVLAELRKERPEDAAAAFEEVLVEAMRAGLAGPWWDGLEGARTNPKALARVVKNLDKARALTDPDGIARFFGAKPEAAPGDTAARHALEREEKERKEVRDVLVSIELLRADLHRSTGAYDLAWAALLEARRFEAKPGEVALRLESALDRDEGFLGLALQALNERIEDDPLDEDLLKERIALYRELGWDRFAEEEAHILAIRAENRRQLEQL